MLSKLGWHNVILLLFRDAELESSYPFCLSNISNQAVAGINCIYFQRNGEYSFLLTSRFVFVFFQTVYDEWFITLYNLVYTSLPVLGMSLFDQVLFLSSLWGFFFMGVLSPGALSWFCEAKAADLLARYCGNP